MTKNPLWDLIEGYMDDPKHRYRPKPADLARETGISEQVLSKWKARPVLPSPQYLLAFSAGTGVPYEDLLGAALRGRLYLPAAGMVWLPDEFKRQIREQDPHELAATGAVLELRGAGVDLSDRTDTPELPAAANKGALEDSGENSI